MVLESGGKEAWNQSTTPEELFAKLEKAERIKDIYDIFRDFISFMPEVQKVTARAFANPSSQEGIALKAGSVTFPLGNASYTWIIHEDADTCAQQLTMNSSDPNADIAEEGISITLSNDPNITMKEVIGHHIRSKKDNRITIATPEARVKSMAFIKKFMHSSTSQPSVFVPAKLN